MLTFLLSVTMISCDEGGDNPIEPSLPDAAFLLDAEAGSSATATCTFADAWQVTTESEAYEINPASGAAGTFDLVVRAKESNEEIREREAHFFVTTGALKKSLLVIQKGTPGIICTAPAYDVAPDARSLTILLDANVAFETETDADWVEVASVKHSDPVLLQDGKTASASLRSTLTLTIGENKKAAERTAHLSLLSSAGTIKVDIRQLAPLVVDWEKAFFRRTALIRFTATWCYNCPVMSEAISMAQETWPDRIIPVNLHATTSKGGLAFYQVAKFEDLYKVEGYPTGIANNMAKIRNAKPAEALVGTIEAVVEEMKVSYPARTGLYASSQITDNKLKMDIHVAVKQKDDYKICAFLLESGITYPQEGATSNYVHDYVVRAALTKELFGDPLPTAESREIVKYTIESELPRSVMNPDNLSVVIAVVRPATPEVQGIEKVIYLDLGTIWDNAVTLSAKGAVAFSYEK